MTSPDQDLLQQLTVTLARRKAEFDETAADMGVEMAATIPIDEVLNLIADLRKVKPQPLHLFEVAVAADTAEQAAHLMSGLVEGQPVVWRPAVQ